MRWSELKPTLETYIIDVVCKYLVFCIKNSLMEIHKKFPLIKFRQKQKLVIQTLLKLYKNLIIFMKKDLLILVHKWEENACLHLKFHHMELMRLKRSLIKVFKNCLP